ncbi:hypothetical protein BU24DRAFT_416395 [Aaosphaeria arxii CBS 175.79]|uniref:DUF7730 domain-containing protein n=1 Tax=Aaosphaeria arxii CBS 175.79 TaxID=1450172 RepID=A0A6A5Y7H6_9PLEO|nr:uncharacterized protein BU24DRAFT_416395 [Aaosphaeria arxii CBS 175.79]KAF2020701.1 hypothetical protein BU24DRAFT_416395 [Aaosphaeria arxii CBS 175.79]
MDNQPPQPRRSSRKRSRPALSDEPSVLPATQKRRRSSYHHISASGRVSTASPKRSSSSQPRPSFGSANDQPCTAEEEEEEETDESEVFRFMDLPAELRVHIYRMALQRAEPLYIHLPQKQTITDDEERYCAPVRRPARAGPCRHRPSRVRLERHDPHAEPIRRPKDSINPALLRTCSLVYKEARQVLYSDNEFVLNLDTGIHSLESLRQRNRSLIKSVALTIPSHHDILDGFADVVRLGLRYCWGLKSLTITLPRSFPDDRHLAGTTNVYANAFHILRWLPKGCRVKMDGIVSESIMRVVADEGRLMDVLDDKEYLKRQHQMPERH